jgi:hypothetical protein
MKKSAWIFMVAATVIVGISVTAFTIPPNRFQPMGGGDPGAGTVPVMGMQNSAALKDLMQLVMVSRLTDDADFIKQVGITNDQKSKIAAIASTYSSAQKPDSDKLAALDTNLAELLKTDTPDITKLDATVDEISAIQASGNKQLLHMALEIRGALTHDQIQKIKDYDANMQKDRGRRSGNRGHGGGWGGHGPGGGNMGGPGGFPGGGSNF